MCFPKCFSFPFLLFHQKITQQVLWTCYGCVKCKCQEMFWRVTLLSDSRNLQVNSVSHETVNGSWEVTSFFWVWYNKESRNKTQFGGLVFLSIFKFHCRVLCYLISLSILFVYKTLWKYVFFLILLIKYIKYQWTYKGLKPWWNSVTYSIYIIMGEVTENQYEVWRRKFFTVVCLCNIYTKDCC